MEKMEIERKFLLQGSVPEFILEFIRQHHPIMVKQTYLCTSGDYEVRLRMEKRYKEVQGRYFLTFKHGKGLSRFEFEEEIPQDAFYKMALKHKGGFITKSRWLIPMEGKTLVLDLYSDFDFCTMEVEFPSEQEANDFKPPCEDWDDVTNNPYYKNKSLWRVLKNADDAIADHLSNEC